VVGAEKDYLFRLRGDQRTMFKLASELLDPADVVARTLDHLDSKTTVTRTLVLLPVEPHWSYGKGKGPSESVWSHAQTFLRVESTKTRDGQDVQNEVRFYVSSHPAKDLTPAQWLQVVRGHWGVEPQHLRHRLRRGRPALDRGGRERDAGHPAPSPDRLHRVGALPGHHAPVFGAQGHALEGPPQLGPRRPCRRHCRRPYRPTSSRGLRRRTLNGRAPTGRRRHRRDLGRAAYATGAGRRLPRRPMAVASTAPGGADNPRTPPADPPCCHGGIASRMSGLRR